ncbi:hypothetical protein A3F28_03070 [Candidatus Uhrbacteria bacterium RIFCSPHIGHO2_12_FULL_57_11]|uniref:Uncharacterized protein n=2 Tax=Candidatus Uhriibacteriota TaxID=1752732 RepID=A0A1F7UIA3_9BACT|nr:MAG: hypothetical protein A3D72_02475 [Candidatus Uhrbacteria bacterium RIFCSPHIGHO2_02_FULL_57_19]OGL78020.1 MAG: hypothetical protein A3F28_03070 [Candidatus Uhrbacteria bacterium RIFCSPHIGHO2_12_FULL_57_11]
MTYHENEEKKEKAVQKNLELTIPWKWIAIAATGLFVGNAFLGLDFRSLINFKKTTAKTNTPVQTAAAPKTEEVSIDQNQILPSQGVALPVRWGDLGKKLVAAGAIDAEKFEALYAARGGLGEEGKALLNGEDNGNLTINSKNSGLLLNLLWAFGLANKNAVLDEGPMQDPKYGGAGKFASTGGWRLAKGDAMEHYSKHALIALTTEEQDLVNRVSLNIYRPCCNNPTYFPDCNHGMAMLGLLELMASQGIGETDMYKIALKVNSFWFPDTYLTMAKYFKTKGIDWTNVDPLEALGPKYSSASGFRDILAEVEPVSGSGGQGCGA